MCGNIQTEIKVSGNHQCLLEYTEKGIVSSNIKKSNCLSLGTNRETVISVSLGIYGKKESLSL